MTKNENENELKQWKKYVIKCNDCGLEFLPWKCLSKTSEETNWKNYCMCPECKHWIDRDASFININ